MKPFDKSVWRKHKKLATLLKQEALEEKGVIGLKRIKAHGGDDFKYCVILSSGVELILTINNLIERGYAVKKSSVTEATVSDDDIQIISIEKAKEKGIVNIEKTPTKDIYRIHYEDGHTIAVLRGWLINQGLAIVKTPVDTHKSEPITKYNISITDRIEANKRECLLVITSVMLSIICMIISQFVSFAMRDVTLVSLANTANSVVVMDTESSKITKNQVGDLGGMFKDTTYNAFSAETSGFVVLGSEYYGLNVVGIYNISNNMVFPSIERMGATENTSLIEGRLPSNADYELGRNTLIMHQSVANFIFGDETSPIGKKILINNQEYTVVGILSDSPDITRLIKQAKDTYEKDVIESFTFPVFTYMKQDSIVSEVFLFFPGEINKSGLDKVRETLKNSGYENIYATAYFDQKEQCLEDQSNNEQLIQIILKIITAIMCFVSLMVIFFSIKERSAEIAIRKTFGATTVSIVSMFLCEIVVCVFVAVSYALPISLFTLVIISSFISAPLGVRILPLNFSIFAIPTILVCNVICIGSLIPLILYSRCKIVDGLKVV